MTINRSSSQIEFVNVNYDGYKFSDYFVSRDPAHGPGWYVFGRNSQKYGMNENGKGRYVMLCARPAVQPRKHSSYNVVVRRGWRTKKEAQAIADRLNLD